MNGHGRIMDPVGRGSVWRVKDTNPLVIPYADLVEANYDDHGNNCGGATYLSENGGKCGLCGDPVGNKEPRLHEDGGKYGKGIIVGQYQAGQTMTANVLITAHYKGYMEFYLCARNDELWSAGDIEDCLEILSLAEGGTQWTLPSPNQSNHQNGGYWYDVDVVLPDVECTRCVLKWRYRGGNNWGCDAPDDCGLGKGDQEEFHNCADIQISKDGSTPTAISPTTVSTDATTLPEGSTCGPWQDQFPRAVISLDEVTIVNNPDGCTEGGHEGVKGSVCYITCGEEYEMKWEDETIPASKKRASVECRWKGNWKVSNQFQCLTPCPALTGLNKSKYVKVKHEWENGFQMVIKLTPKFDLNEWTVVFYFKEPPTVNIEYYSWEAKLTVSANSRIATLTSQPWNIGIKKGETYSFLFIVTGGSRSSSNFSLILNNLDQGIPHRVSVT